MRWRERPVDEAALFNPAFCCALLQQASWWHMKESSRGIPIPLTFLVLPLVLHARTRRALPARVTVGIHTWVEQNPDVRVRFADHVKSLAGITRDAILFGLQNKHLSIENGNLTSKQFSLSSSMTEVLTEDSRDCFSASKFVGRWFSRLNDTATMFVIWGIRP